MPVSPPPGKKTSPPRLISPNLASLVHRHVLSGAGSLSVISAMPWLPRTEHQCLRYDAYGGCYRGAGLVRV